MDLRWVKQVFFTYYALILFFVPLAGLLAEGLDRSYWLSVAPTMLIIDSTISVVLTIPLLLITKIWSGMHWFEVFNWEAMVGLILFGGGFGLYSYEVEHPPPSIGSIYSICPATGCPTTAQEMTWHNLYDLGISLVTLGAVFLFIAVARLRIVQPDQETKFVDTLRNQAEPMTALGRVQ